MNRLLRLFKKREFKLYSFYNGIEGLKQQDDFLKFASDNDIRIISMYIQYHEYNSKHIPKSFNYIIEL